MPGRKEVESDRSTETPSMQSIEWDLKRMLAYVPIQEKENA
jgi:hypothetical protein